MKYRLEKCLQIVNDICLLCAGLGATEYQVSLVPGTEVASFTVAAKVTGLADAVVEELRHDLKQPRQHEVEEIYWSISYDTSDPCEAMLIGVMLDEAEVMYDGVTLTITASRGK